MPIFITKELCEAHIREYYKQSKTMHVKATEIEQGVWSIACIKIKHERLKWGK